MIRALGTLILVFLLVGSVASAQESAPTFNSLNDVEEFLGVDLPEDFDWENFDPVVVGPGLFANSTSAPEGTVSCFDYYEFNSVDVQITNPVETALPGDEQTFKVSLTNQNSYPLVDGSLYVKIFRARDNNIDTQINGDNIVDSFTALEDVTLAGGGTGEYTFTWTPSDYLPAGDYYAAGYYITSDRFNLSGLTFTDDIIGGKGDFTVVSDNGAFYFDKDNVKINGADHQFISAPPRISGDGPVEIVAAVKNDSSEELTGLITWHVYYWDAQREEHLVDTDDEAVVVPAGGSVDISYTLGDSNHSVYLVVPTLKRNGQTISQLNVRLVRSGVNTPRLNFPALTVFPLEIGKPSTLFSCLHNAGTNPVVSDTELELVLADKSGNVIESLTYSGVTTGDMMAVAEKFTPEASYNQANLTATLSKGGQVVDQVTISYDCETIDPSRCLEIEDEEVEEEEEGLMGLMQNTTYQLFGLVALGILFILVIVMIIVIKRKKSEDDFDDYEIEYEE